MVTKHTELQRDKIFFPPQQNIFPPLALPLLMVNFILLLPSYHIIKYDGCPVRTQPPLEDHQSSADNGKVDQIIPLMSVAREHSLLR